ncbi:LysM peptidoglycan-binding domain-containing protein [Verrucomicrobiota bacterium]
MKTWALITIVVFLHCGAIGALFFIQGCGTTASTEIEYGTAVVPPAEPPATPDTLPAEPKRELRVREKPKVPSTVTYTVRSGDSVSKIGQRYNVSEAEVVALNRLKDPNKIWVGQKLLLPGYVDLGKPVTRSSSPAPAVDSEGEYVVQRGDSISKIAQRFNVSKAQIAEVNNLADPNKIWTGQKLVIPEATTEPVSEFASSSDSLAVSEESTTTVLTVVDEEDNAVSVSEIVHVVQPGEDLFSIAKLYAVTVGEIAELNNLSRNARVKVGQRLKIP